MPADSTRPASPYRALDIQSASSPKSAAPGYAAPSILLILLDDVGFGDTSTFGGPAQTPWLTKLAADGLRYNQFHTAGLCSPTRAALLSGRNHHRMGFGTVGAADYPGYNALWKKSTASIAEILRRHGYSTAAFGKWHNTPYREISPVGPFDHWPTQLGFEYYYGNMLGVSSQWEPELWRNTVVVQRPNNAGRYHYTTDIIDESINWLKLQRTLAPDKPYFMYVATGAAHAPHHVSNEWIERYKGRFDQGWDVLREEIFSRQAELGVIPSGTVLAPRPVQLPLWSALSADEQLFAARQMEVYAAFIEHTDYEIGRLIDVVRRLPNGDNTLVLYIVGDNGASAESISGVTYAAKSVLPADEHPDVEGLGGSSYYNNYSAGWAIAGNTPFPWAKGIASHFGATRNPLVVSWPARIRSGGETRTQFTHVNDVASTLLEVAGIDPPSVIDGAKQLPFDGVSFAYSFQTAEARARARQQYFEIWGNRALYKDGWIASARHKLPWEVKSRAKLDDPSMYANDQWELYDLNHDFAQANDVAKKYPRKLEELKRLFDQAANANDVYPLISANIHGNMPPIERRKHFIFPAGAGVLGYNAPQFLDPDVPSQMPRFRIDADVLVPDSGAEGIIVSYGWKFFGGFCLYVAGNRLIYEQDFTSGHARLESRKRIPSGRGRLTLEIDGGGANASRGHARLRINDEIVGEAEIPPMEGVGFGFFGVGETFGSAPAGGGEAPYRFTGKIDNVSVDLR